jgi:hypothetical protein
VRERFDATFRLFFFFWRIPRGEAGARAAATCVTPFCCFAIATAITTIIIIIIITIILSGCERQMVDGRH